MKVSSLLRQQHWALYSQTVKIIIVCLTRHCVSTPLFFVLLYLHKSFVTLIFSLVFCCAIAVFAYAFKFLLLHIVCLQKKIPNFSFHQNVECNTFVMPKIHVNYAPLLSYYHLLRIWIFYVRKSRENSRNGFGYFVRVKGCDTGER